jgi:26S proteasome regulatory subunit N3
MAITEDTKMADVVPAPLSAAAEDPASSSLAGLLAAARRLEKLLSEAAAAAYYTSPVKTVRRWLGTSASAAAAATQEDVILAATILLDSSSSPSDDDAQSIRNLIIMVDGPTSKPAVESSSSTSSPQYLVASAREVESWLLSLLVRLLWRKGNHAKAFHLVNSAIAILEEQDISKSSSSSSLYPLLARLYRFRFLVQDQAQDPSEHRQLIAKAYNRAVVRRDVDTQAVLLNGMIRELLQQSQVEQAQKLLANSTFPVETASNNQLCRYLYYSGRIQALRLEYTASFASLSQCLRKAPPSVLGFRIAAQRLQIVVQLLMGEIPERHVFFGTGMQRALAPYLAITQAVQRGDLAVFHQVVAEHAARLQADATYTLIARLAHQVVKAGLRKLHISYSRLSLQDVADRLSLASPHSAEYVVAKAVRDGVLDATIHHEEGYVQSHDLVDVYATKEPAEAFHRRIAYCLTTHNDAVRGMRYPPDAYKKQLEASRGNRRKRSDDKTDEEKAKELEEEFEEDY